MKYLIAFLLIPAVQFAFLLAFIVFALGFWMSSVLEKSRPGFTAAGAERPKPAPACPRAAVS